LWQELWQSCADARFAAALSVAAFFSSIAARICSKPGCWYLSNTGANAVPWSEAVARMQHDAVYCSAVEANFAPHFERVERALEDEDLLKQLQRLR